MVCRVLVVVWLLLLASCGGNGDAPLNRHAQQLAGKAGRVAERTAIDATLFTRKQAMAAPVAATAAAATDTATQLFEVGDTSYSEFFPSRETSRTVGGFTYRFYPLTKAYLIVDEALRVYVLGGPFGSQITLVGVATDFLTPPSPVCAPVTASFDIQKLDLAPGGGTGGDGDGDGGGGGVGSNGSEGAIRGADVKLYDSTGALLGTAVSDDKGMVTLRACGLVGPFRIEYVGNATAQYFDEGIAARDGSDSNAWVPFPAGEKLTAFVEDLSSHHVVVSPLTQMAALELQLAPGGAAAPDRARALAAAGAERSGRVHAAAITVNAVRAANERVRLLFNQQFVGSGLAITDITRVPALAYGIDSLRAFRNDQRGQYGQVLTALAKSAAQFNPNLPNPAREMTKQLVRDFSDGVIDGKDSTGAPVAVPGQQAYDKQLLKASLVRQANGRLVTQPLGQGSITVTSSSQTAETCASGSGQCFPFGTVVNLSAQAAAGWTFQGWSGACSGSGNCQVTMSGDKGVFATFITSGPQLTVVKGGAGNGIVTSSPSGIFCGSSCSAAFPQGTTVTLQASAGNGATFSGWSEPSCSGASCTVMLNAARTVTANFAAGVVLSVAKAGNGGGLVYSTAVGINCGSSCSATVPPGTLVSLVAAPAPGASFIGWSDPACTGNVCQVAMNSARTLTATFGADATLSLAVLGSGTVTAAGGEISCSAVCSKVFPYGTSLVLTATPAAGFRFAGWSGACSGTANPCTVTMDAARSVTANFEQAPSFQLSVTVGAGGTVSSSPAGISNCSNGTCTALFVQGTPVSLSASPFSGSTFSSWGGDCSGSAGCSVQMTTNRSVSASFRGGLYQLGGTISGLSASGLRLANGNVLLLIPGGATQFSFGPVLSPGVPYNVTVAAQPSGQQCSVSNGSGTAPAADVNTVAVVCGSASVGWAWMGGSRMTGGTGVYGSLGVASTANIPGSRLHAATWKDASGNLWLFGGVGDSQNSVRFNDLWRFNPASRTWAWMGGSSQAGAAGVYGVQGQAASRNIPGARWGAKTWVDGSGNFWLFGGVGVDSSGDGGLLNDLWRYNPGAGTWTWVKGSSAAYGSGFWGALGSINDSRVPSAREAAASWVDRNGDLWLFGGIGNDVSGAYGTLGDLWKFSINQNAWGWMGGSNVTPGTAVYGVRGQPSSGNRPSGRVRAAAWTDSSGNLWLFGGNADSTLESRLNDLWRYDPGGGTWTWMSGDNSTIGAPVYGVQGVAAAANVPGARSGAAAWVDAAGTVWLLGGYGRLPATFTFVPTGYLNDLWRYTPSDGLWTWMAGTNTIDALGLYGSLGVAAAGNRPGGIYAPATWFDPATGLWLFGGTGYGEDSGPGQLNSLWRR